MCWLGAIDTVGMVHFIPGSLRLPKDKAAIDEKAFISTNCGFLLSASDAFLRTLWLSDPSHEVAKRKPSGQNHVFLSCICDDGD
jgi:hypothetical protein